MENLKNITPVEDFNWDAYENGEAVTSMSHEDLEKAYSYADQFIQVVPIEYKKVLQEEQMQKLQQKIAEMQRDY